MQSFMIYIWSKITTAAMARLGMLTVLLSVFPPVVSAQTLVSDPIGAGQINGGDQWTVGDFNGDGITDVYFWWKVSGGNRLFLGTSNGSFTQQPDNQIGAGQINGGDQWTVGDFNGDGITDVYFWWKTSGANRLFLGVASLTPFRQEQLSLLRDYFGRLSELSNPLDPSLEPPGPNAANGWFREAIVNDSKLKFTRDELRKDWYTTNGTDRIRSLFIAFDEIWDAFAEHPNYTAKWTTHSTLFWQQADYVGGDLLGIVIGALRVYFGDANGWGDIAISIGYLLDDLQDSPLILSGTHANGHIADAVRRAAQDTLQHINSTFGSDFSGYEGQIARRLKLICEYLSTLGTAIHDPWLQADWQISFYASMEVGNLLMKDVLAHYSGSQPLGKVSGEVCEADTECYSGACFPGPGDGDPKYCLHPDMNCSWPDSDGYLYGAKMTMSDGRSVQCMDPGAGSRARFAYVP